MREGRKSKLSSFSWGGDHLRLSNGAIGTQQKNRSHTKICPQNLRGKINSRIQIWLRFSFPPTLFYLLI